MILFSVEFHGSITVDLRVYLHTLLSAFSYCIRQLLDFLLNLTFFYEAFLIESLINYFQEFLSL